MELGELFKPRTIEEQLGPALSAIGKSWADYRRNITRTTSALAAAGKVVMPYFTQDSYEGRCEELVQMICALKQTLIISHDADIFPNFNRQKLAKKYNLTTTERFYSVEEENRVTCEEAVKKALKELKPSDVRVGIDFKGVHESNRTYKAFTLLDCIRASIADRSLPEGTVTIDLYIDTDQIWKRGGDAHVVVPSFSSDKKYEFDLRHIPIHRGTIDEQVVRTSFDFYSTDSYSDTACERAAYYVIKYGRRTVSVFGRDERKGDEILLDHHTILAFKRAKEKIKRQYGYGVVDPFPEPDGQTLKFFLNLLGGVIIESREGRYIRRQPVGNAKVLMEIMLQKYVGCRNKTKNQLSSSAL